MKQVNKDLFAGRDIVIATMHKKEEVIAPLLSLHLGLKPFACSGINTDLLGSFSGEIKRLSDPLETARKKCMMGMEQSGCSLGIASEGSFGSHPAILFGCVNEEWVVLIDAENKFEISHRVITMETNFMGRTVQNREELLEFAQKAQFPIHKLTLKDSEHDPRKIKKGIGAPKSLLNWFDKFQKANLSIWVETDMRAMSNPTRMGVIRKATEGLINKAKSKCPSCLFPGFSVSRMSPGLPCEACGFPTESILIHHYECKYCGHSEDKENPDGLLMADPMHCGICNP